MTPQELESMPDRGLEFEASVGPKCLNVDISLKSSSDIISSVSLIKNKTAQVTKLAQNTSTSNDTITVTNSKLNLVQVHQPLNIQSVAHPNHKAGTLQIVQNQLIALQSPKLKVVLISMAQKSNWFRCEIPHLLLSTQARVINFCISTPISCMGMTP